MRKNDGFSLIELIIVIAVMGIILAIAAPNFTRYRDNTNLREAARDISSDIQLYKQRAIAENVQYSITFNAGTNDYVIQRNGVTIVTRQVGGNNPVEISGSPAPSFSGGVPTVSLLPRGTATLGSMTLRHATRLSEARIIVNIMGRVRVEYDLK
jgi:type II secretion system protein H